MSRLLRSLLFLFLVSLLCACQPGGEPAPSPAAAKAPSPPPLADGAPSGDPATTAPGAIAPQPPLRETFDGQPQLSLFPRVGGYRPEDSEKEALAYWDTFIEHLLRTAGVLDKGGRNETRGWLLRNLDSLDSVAFFSPIAVKPATEYRVSFDFSGDLAPELSAGVGILEFDRFLWIGDQFTEAQCKKHQTGAQVGSKLGGRQPWQTHTFTFRSAPATNMIHLVLFCDGRSGYNGRALFDNLVIEEVAMADNKGR